MITDSEYHDDFEAYLKRRVSIDRRLALIDRLEPPPELDPEAAPSVWHPARETASETVRTASNIDAMRLKFICFPMNVGRARTNRWCDVRRS